MNIHKYNVSYCRNSLWLMSNEKRNKDMGHIWARNRSVIVQSCAYLLAVINVTATIFRKRKCVSFFLFYIEKLIIVTIKTVVSSEILFHVMLNFNYKIRKISIIMHKK